MKTVFLMAGGNWRNRREPDPGLIAALKEVGRQTPSIAYVGTANNDDPSFLKWFTALALEAGAGRVKLAPLAGRRSDPAEALRVLDEADAVFVAGGDVDAGMRALESAGVCDRLRALHTAGKPFMGMSAGSIMLAKAWVRWPDESDGNVVETFACLGIAPVYCDTHGEPDDWEELRALLRLCDTGTTGYGIPTGCTLVVRHGGSVSSLAGPVHRFSRTARETKRLPDIAP
jgi:hypothetical protein